MTTTIADVMVIYATLPFVAAAIGLARQPRARLDRRTLIASVVALAGVAVMVIDRARRRAGSSARRCPR